MLTIALNLPQGDGRRGDGRGTEVGRQRLGGVGGHAPEVLLPEHLPPGGRARERLRPVLLSAAEGTIRHAGLKYEL